MDSSSTRAPAARLVRVFAPARDFDLSRRFYRALGWRELWSQGGLAELELAGARLYLQDYYDKGWAENFMVHVVVDSADAWHAHAERVLASREFAPARVAPPKLEPYGARVTYVWDPSGVLLHFAEPIGEASNVTVSDSTVSDSTVSDSTASDSTASESTAADGATAGG